MIYIYIIREFHNGNEKKEEKIERDIALSKILSRKFIDPLSGIKKKKGGNVTTFDLDKSAVKRANPRGYDHAL